MQVPGGLLSIGDLHACMGAGEAALVAIESGGAATVRVTLIKNMGMVSGESDLVFSLNVALFLR